MSFFNIIVVLGILLSLNEVKANEDDFQCPEEYRYEIYEKPVTITSPFYGKEKEYRTGLKCSYKLIAPRGFKIKVIFQDFDLRPSAFCSADYLRISDPSLFSSDYTFCGNKPPKTFLTRRNELNLFFNTDYIFTSGRQGFSLQAIATLNDSVCDEGFTLCENRNCYDNNKRCDGIDDCGDGTDEENCGFPNSVTECGNPPIAPKTEDSVLDRIVGGEVARPHSWPWQASFRLRTRMYSHFCGGTLLNSLWVLSASHCFWGIYDADFIEVHFGSHNKQESSSFYQIRKAVKIIAYPDLEGRNISKSSLQDDVALVKLNTPVQFTDGVQLACLPAYGSELKIGDTCFTSGWGETRGSGNDKFLKQTKQVVVTESECDYKDYTPQTQLCLNNYKNSPCKGDSGGPLVCKKDGKWYVYGATSLGTRINEETLLCATPGLKMIYAKVSEKAIWIKSIIEKYS